MIIGVAKSFTRFLVGTVLRSIMIVGALTRCTLLYSMHCLEATQMNMQCSLIRKYMLPKQPKIFVLRKVNVQLFTTQY